MMTHPRIEIEKIQVISLYDCSSKALLDFYIKNKKHLANSMPLRENSFYTEEYWEQQIVSYIELFKEKKAIKFVLVHKGIVIGTITFDQIIYGVFRSCYLGYSLDQDYQGQGIMFKALMFCLDYIFNQFNLNRVMANYIPENTRSRKLLQR
ncbi:GNAT family N-acetyltransferase, partial [Acinetobacter baumannii]